MSIEQCQLGADSLNQGALTNARSPHPAAGRPIDLRIIRLYFTAGRVAPVLYELMGLRVFSEGASLLFLEC